jgi:molybdate/tungstate transport system ATP-binding protein
MLRLDNISASVGSFKLRNISFAVEKGEYFVVLGPSGVGKSLLLETIAGLRSTDAGTIHLRGVNITSERIQKRNISIVYQDADLFPHLTVHENIAYPLRSRRERDIGGKVRAAAELIGISDKLDRKPLTLSGGEYQRVSLARSIAADSDIILLDEPLSSIDTKSRGELRGLLRTINRKGITVIHVTHDYEEAISVASKIGIMEEGRLVHVDSPQEIFKHPKSEFVAHFIGVKNFLRGQLQSVEGSELKTFTTNGLLISCLTDAPDGEAFLMIGPEEISIANSRQSTSNRNQFEGVIRDIAQARLGIEVSIDIGCDLVVVISSEARKSLALEIGKDVCLSFKASSCKIYASGGIRP